MAVDHVATHLISRLQRDVYRLKMEMEILMKVIIKLHPQLDMGLITWEDLVAPIRKEISENSEEAEDDYEEDDPDVVKFEW